MTEATCWQVPRRVSVVVDNDSWILPWAEQLVDQCRRELGDDAGLVRSYEVVPEGEVAFLLGCTGLAPPHVLARNRYNLVVHESAVPEGRGFAPLTWQILEGRNEIMVSLLGVGEEADAGPVYLQRSLRFEGHELNAELRAAQGRTTVELCLAFLAADAPPEGEVQQGEPTWYRQRTPADSELDPNRTIAQQFEQLRVADNERYPAYFDYRGHRYVLRIEKSE